MLELIHPAERFRNIRVADTRFHCRLSFCQKLSYWKLQQLDSLRRPASPIGPPAELSSRTSRVIRGRQGTVFGIDDEYGKQLRRFSIARVATDQMMCSRRLIPALARAVDVFGLTLYLACDLARNDVRIDERRVRMMVRCGGATRWV